jgi:S1-C subfamily serine protease
VTDKLPDLTKLDDDELAKLDAKLAKERTDLRLQQNAVANEQTFRQALKGMSPDQQAAFAVRVGGDLKHTSATSAEKAN